MTQRVRVQFVSVASRRKFVGGLVDALKHSEPVAVMEVHQKSVVLEAETFVVPIIQNVLQSTGGELSHLPNE